MVLRDPASLGVLRNRFVMYFTAHDPSNHTLRPSCHCTNGTSGQQCARMPWGAAPTWMSCE
jgi:hypothetical protein